MNSVFVDIPTATKQAAGREGGPASFLLHESKSNLNKLERVLNKFKIVLLGLNMIDKCTSNSSFSGYSLNDDENL